MTAPRVALVCLGLVAAWSRAAEPVPGTVTADLPCLADAQHSYALYLPRDYVATRPWPIVLFFTPDARGAQMVERYREAAEARGWILAASNTARNGPYEPVMEAAEAMWNDVQARFTVDPALRCTGGFSGGARVAMRWAGAHPEAVSGVLAFGALLPGGRLPDTLPYAIYAAVGHDDINLSEFRNTARALEQRKADYWIEVFRGGHTAPSAELFGAGLDFLAGAAAVRAGAADAAAPHERFRDGALARAERLEAEVPLAALGAYEQIAARFAGTPTGARAASRARELAGAEPVRESRAHSAALSEHMGLLLAPDDKDFARGLLWFQEALRHESALAGSAGHALGGAFFALRSQGLHEHEAGAHAVAARHFSRAAAIVPHDPETAYNAACAYARAADLARAMLWLRRATDRGFRDVRHMRADADLQALRDLPAFQALVVELEALPTESLMPPEPPAMVP